MKSKVGASGLAIGFADDGSRGDRVCGWGCGSASLWNVNDASTALIMQQFSQTLSQTKLTKAEALQKIQQDFISGKLTGKDAPRREADILVQLAPGVAEQRANRMTFTHPFYWAPFVLTGNNL